MLQITPEKVHLLVLHQSLAHKKYDIVEPNSTQDKHSEYHTLNA